MDDSKLRQDVLDELNWQPHIPSAHITVTADRGIVHCRRCFVEGTMAVRTRLGYVLPGERNSIASRVRRRTGTPPW